MEEATGFLAPGAMLDNRIRFRHLQSFLAIAQHRSVRVAADALSITQPALSKSLRELEEALGARLFDRDKKGMLLTRPGELFLQHAAASVASLRHGVGSVRIATTTGGLAVAIGVLPNAAARVMPLAVDRFKRDAPETTVRIVTSENATLLDLLRLGELDFVLGRLAQPEHMVGLTFEQLYSESLVFVVRPTHPLTRARRFKLSMIGEYPCLLPHHGTIIRDELDRFLIAKGVPRPKNIVETMSIAFGRTYTRESEAVWFTPRGVVEEELAGGSLVELPAGAMQGPVGITAKEDVTPTSATLLMLEAVRNVADALRG